MNKSKRPSILIIGEMPPPIGGVTIHVSRLFMLLSKEFHVKIFSYKNNPLYKVLMLIWQARNDVVHLHASNPVFRAAVSVLSYFIGVKLFVTFHGNIGRYGYIGNMFDKISLLFSYVPVVLNSGSFAVASRFNSRSVLMSAFIPPIDNEILSEDISERLASFRDRYNIVCCTNAYDVSFDVDGREIYGVVDLIYLFGQFPNIGLFISDPSGNYIKYLRSMDLFIGDNVMFIGGSHSFYEAMRYADIFIRNTVTDGDSLSIHEALSLSKTVFATNVVSRPSSVIQYSDLQGLRDILSSYRRGDGAINATYELNNIFEDYKKLYIFNL